MPELPPINDDAGVVLCTCPHCGALVQRAGDDVTIIHRRSAQSLHMSVGVQCSSCHTRLVVHLGGQGTGSEGIRVVGHSSLHSDRIGNIERRSGE
jgi:phage terminase large subunit GpA-like protein